MIKTQLFKIKRRGKRQKHIFLTMGSYDHKTRLDCSWCGKQERESFHKEIDGIGPLCLRCEHHGPPHFEYLLDLLGNRFPIATATATAERVIIKIAAFAYEPCTITEVSALENGFANEDDYECDFCDDSWKGWTCQYCLKRS